MPRPASSGNLLFAPNPIIPNSCGSQLANAEPPEQKQSLGADLIDPIATFDEMPSRLGAGQAGQQRPRTSGNVMAQQINRARALKLES